MEMHFEKRNCILESGTIEDVIKTLMARLDKTDMPVTFKISQSDDEKWGVFYEYAWKPYFNMSCVDKVDGMLIRVKRFMKKSNGRTLFLRVEGHMGVRGLNYYLELA